MPTTLAEWIEACDELSSNSLNYFGPDGPVGEIFDRFIRIDESFRNLQLPVVQQALGAGVAKFSGTWAQYASPVSRQAQQWSTLRAQLGRQPEQDALKRVVQFGTEFGKDYTNLYNKGFIKAAEALDGVATRILDALDGAIDADIANHFEELHRDLDFLLDTVNRVASLIGIGVAIAGVFTPIPVAGVIAAGLGVAATRITTLLIKKVVIHYDQANRENRAEALARLNLANLPSATKTKLLELGKLGLLVVTVAAEAAAPGITAGAEGLSEAGRAAAEHIVAVLEQFKEAADYVYEGIERSEDLATAWEWIVGKISAERGNTSWGREVLTLSGQDLKDLAEEQSGPALGQESAATWARWGTGQDATGRLYYAGFYGEELYKQFPDGTWEKVDYVWVERFDQTGESGWIYPDGRFETDTQAEQAAAAAAAQGPAGPELYWDDATERYWGWYDNAPGYYLCAKDAYSPAAFSANDFVRGALVSGGVFMPNNPDHSQEVAPSWLTETYANQ